jgi:hypothetical protein
LGIPELVVVLAGPEGEHRALRIAEHRDGSLGHLHRPVEHAAAEAFDLLQQPLDVLVAEVRHPARRRSGSGRSC